MRSLPANILSPTAPRIRSDRRSGPGSKAFNTVYFKTLQSEAHRGGDRLGIPLAGDDPGALQTAADLVRDAGFDPVIIGPLVRGKDFEPNTRPYNTGMTGSELRALFGQPA